jgi:hypothetical protein
MSIFSKLNEHMLFGKTLDIPYAENAKGLHELIITLLTSTMEIHILLSNIKYIYNDFFHTSLHYINYLQSRMSKLYLQLLNIKVKQIPHNTNF